MSAFMVSREHIDLIVGVALEGPSGVPVAPDSAVITSFPTRWYAKQWHEVDSYAEFEQGRRRLVPRRYAGDDEFNRDPHQLGQLLVDANLKSIHARYPDTQHDGTVPGPCEPYWEQPYLWQRQHYRMTAVEALQAIACLDYQSCEHAAWRISEARRFLDSLEHGLINCLPGYREAPWGWDAEQVKKARAGKLRRRAA